MKYLILSASLPDGDYKTSKGRWHERLKARIIKWLYLSIKKDCDIKVETTTGSSTATLWR